MHAPKPASFLTSLLIYGGAISLLGCPDYNVSRIEAGDRYTQGVPERPVDVLWVIDNSATMTEEQATLLGNFQDFSDVIYQTSIDFQVGVITTDAEHGLGLLTSEVLTADTVDLDEAFTEAVDVGVTGNREEMPLESILLATSSEALAAGNSALFREDADLQIIVLTDEDDQSDGEVQAYLDHLTDFKDAADYRISLIGGPLPSGCASTTSSSEPATRLLEAVEATDGLFKSVCEGDFGPVMKSLAFNTTGMTDTFALSRFPDLSSLEVRVDGVMLHQRPENGWQYDAAKNSVVLDGLAVPRPGQTISLVYYEIFGADASSDE